MDYDKNEIEHFHVFGGECRVSDDGGGDDFILEGLAAVFDQWAELGPFRERIRPGAFDAALPTSDVRLLVNHEGLPLARTTSGTLDLTATSKGLEMRARLSKRDPDVLALIPKIERGDLSQFSFAFDVGSDGQDFVGNDRTITSFAEIFDVSLVTFPAFEKTKITALRMIQKYHRGLAEDDVNASRLREELLRRYW